MSQQENNKFFYLTLKKKTGKSGGAFYTAKFAYAVEIIAFEKKDGSGDITLWLQPKDMDQMKQVSQARQGNHPYTPANQPTRNLPKPNPSGYVDHTKPRVQSNVELAPREDAPWPDDEF